MKNAPARMAVKRLRRSCRLSDGRCDLRLHGVVNNVDMSRLCGAVVSGAATVRKAGKTLLAEEFETFCTRRDPVVVRIELRPGQPPRIDTVPWEDFYR